MNNKIILTMGDPIGIGPEVMIKALNRLNIHPSKAIIIGSKSVLDAYDKKLGLKLNNNYEFYEVEAGLSNGRFCYESLKLACDLLKSNKAKALVTAPISKKSLNQAGYMFSGQTEILDTFLSKIGQRAEMLFVLGNFRVLLLTRHIPLSDVEKSLTKQIVEGKIRSVNKILKTQFGLDEPKLAICGLNPHAGESGVIGTFERDILNELLNNLRKEGIKISKPQPADTLFVKVLEAFQQKQKLPYDCYLACYHDQGLIPMKLLGMNKAVNITVGLDWIRTSPSHGTATDIAGKGIANPDSMIEAVKFALKSLD